MASIDERVVAMSFENAKFEAGVAQTLKTLQKLNDTLAKVGSVNGLENIEKAGNKVTLQGPMSALDKLRQRLFGASTGAAEGFSGIDAAGNKVTLQGPTSALDRLRARLFGASQGAAEGMGGIEAAGNKVTLGGPISALDRLRTRLFGVGNGAVEGFASVERAGNGVTLGGPIRAVGRVQRSVASVGTGAVNSFGAIERAGNHVTLGGIKTATSGVTRGFSVMQGVASVALGGIAAQAAVKGASMVKSLSLNPVIDGFHEYTTNLNSIQTILANTRASGANLNDVNGALQSLNKYSDQTIYNFSEMAKNIGTFTAAGVDLDTATGSIKGIANLAAISGSNSEQASTAMYQLSQAISAGRVSLQDWNSVVNAGMGGTVFQRALAQTAQQMGTLSKGAVTLHGKMKNVTIGGKSFRESITAKPGEKSWLTSKVLTTTLKNFTGDLSLAQIKAEGFSTAQAKAIMAQAKAAKNAATQVKTIGGVIDVVKESIGSGWATTFQIIFGDFKEAKGLFTGVTKDLQNIIGNSAKSRNAVLKDWKKLGGRDVLISGIKNAFLSLVTILRPLKNAFREVFPKKTGQDLLEMTKHFRDLMARMAIGPETAAKLQATFRGFFSLLHIGWTIIKDVGKVLGHLFSLMGGKHGGLLTLTASFGQFLTALDQGISKGKSFDGIFKGLENVLRAPIELIKGLGRAIGGLFGGSGNNEKQASQMKNQVGIIQKALGPLGRALAWVADKIKTLFGFLHKVADFFKPFVEKFVELWKTVADAMIKGIKQINFDRVMQALQVAMTGGIAVGLKKLAKGIGINFGGSVGFGLNKGTLKAITDVTGALTQNLKSMQRGIDAAALAMIASAILALAIAANTFSKIDPKALARSMTAIAVGMGELVGGLHLLMAFGGVKGAISLPVMAAGMLIMAGALVVMAAAVKSFSKMDWKEMARGLAGVAGSLVVIGGAAKLMGPDLLYIGPGLMGVALAMNILAVAMKIMGSMSWDELTKGLLGVGTSIGVLAFALEPMVGAGPQLLLIGASLGLMAGGLILLAAAVSSFGAISLLDTAKGIYSMALAIKLLATGLEIMPEEGIAAKAVGIGLLAGAMILVAAAIGAMGSMKLETIAKGLVTMGAALFELSVGLTIMEGTGPGALALLAAATALAILAPVLVTLGVLKWSTIAKGLITMAAAMGIIGGLGLVVSEGILALGIGLGVLAAAAVLGAGALYLFAAAIGEFADNGSKGFAVMIAAITAFIAALPTMAINFIKGLVQILDSVVQLSPKIATALVSIITTFSQGIIQLQPQFLAIIGMLLTSLITLIYKYSYPLVGAGIHLLMALLSGIANNIGNVTGTVARIVAGFLGALANHIGDIINAGARLLIRFLGGLVKNMPHILAAGARAISAFLTGVNKHLPDVMNKGAQVVVTFLTHLAAKVPDVLRAATRVGVAVLEGIAKAVPKLARSATNVIIAFVRALGNNAWRVADAGAAAIIDFMNGIARSIRHRAPEMRQAGANIGWAIAAGLVGGITDKWDWVIGKITSLTHLIPKPIRKVLKMKSPSRVMMALGQNISEGLAIGITAAQPKVMYALGGLTTTVTDGTNEAISNIPAALNGMGPMNPVITPILDLSQVEKDAQKLNALTRVDQIDPAKSSYYGASAVSAALAASQLAKAEDTSAHTMEVKFEQHNTSPESLSAIEIYRQTQNQLSQLKKVVVEA